MQRFTGICKSLFFLISALLLKILIRPLRNMQGASFRDAVISLPSVRSSNTIHGAVKYEMKASAAYRALLSLVIRLCGRIAHRARCPCLPTRTQPMRDEVDKAMRITGRDLPCCRQTGIVPHAFIGIPIRRLRSSAGPRPLLLSRGGRQGLRGHRPSRRGTVPQLYGGMSDLGRPAARCE